MPFGWVAAAGAASGILGANAAKGAANTQADASNHAVDVQRQMFDITNENQRPYREAGYGALNQLQTFSGQDPANANSFLHKFGANDLNANLAPNYQFQLEQGQGAVRNAANASGGLLSGNTLKGIADYTTGKAGDAYQQAFQNYTANQTNIFNRLASIAGLGQTANQATSTAATAAGGQIGTALQNAGAARAAGQVGSANAISGGLNNAASWYAINNMVNGRGGGGGGSPFYDPNTGTGEFGGVDVGGIGSPGGY